MHIYDVDVATETTLVYWNRRYDVFVKWMHPAITNWQMGVKLFSLYLCCYQYWLLNEI